MKGFKYVLIFGILCTALFGFWKGIALAAAPVISNVTSTSITTSTAILTWTTDVLSNSIAAYGTSTALGTNTSTPGQVTSHSVSLTNLASATLYYYLVESINSSGTTTSTEQTFNTLDVTAPTIPQNVTGTALSSTSISLAWTSSTDNSGVVSYNIFRADISTSTTHAT